MQVSTLRKEPHMTLKLKQRVSKHHRTDQDYVYANPYVNKTFPSCNKSLNTIIENHMV